MTVSKKIKITHKKNRAKQSSVWFRRQTAKISALSSGNVDKYEFLKIQLVLPEEGLLGKSATNNRFEYSPLDKTFYKNRIGTDEKYILKVINALLYLPEEQVEKYRLSSAKK